MKLFFWRRESRAKKTQATKKDKVFKALFSAQGFPIVLTLAILGVLLVLFRMKGVEQDYQYDTLIRKTNKANLENKELKAKRAQKTSVKNLRKFASKYNLKRPKQNQIIIIP